MRIHNTESFLQMTGSARWRCVLPCASACLLAVLLLLSRTDQAAGQGQPQNGSGIDWSACHTPLAQFLPAKGSGLKTSGDECPPGQFRYSITECDLFDIMEKPVGDPLFTPIVTAYLPHILQAMVLYDLNCPRRIAAFLAQVRHETAGLTTFYQPRDGGAGAIHMVPKNFRLACQQIPNIKNEFSNVSETNGSWRFAECAKATEDPCGCGTDPEAAQVIMRPEFAFLTGGWWFKTGSTQILGFKGCGDLRAQADVGLGEMGPPKSTGYFEVSRCVFGDLATDTGLNQRVAYYDAAWRKARSFVFQGNGTNSSTPPQHAPEFADSIDPAIVLYAAIFVAAASLVMFAVCSVGGSHNKDPDMAPGQKTVMPTHAQLADEFGEAPLHRRLESAFADPSEDRDDRPVFSERQDDKPRHDNDRHAKITGTNTQAQAHKQGAVKTVADRQRGQWSDSVDGSETEEERREEEGRERGGEKDEHTVQAGQNMAAARADDKRAEQPSNTTRQHQHVRSGFGQNNNQNNSITQNTNDTKPDQANVTQQSGTHHTQHHTTQPTHTQTVTHKPTVAATVTRGPPIVGSFGQARPAKAGMVDARAAEGSISEQAEADTKRVATGKDTKKAAQGVSARGGRGLRRRGSGGDPQGVMSEFD